MNYYYREFKFDGEEYKVETFQVENSRGYDTIIKLHKKYPIFFGLAQKWKLVSRSKEVIFSKHKIKEFVEEYLNDTPIL